MKNNHSPHWKQHQEVTTVKEAEAAEFRTHQDLANDYVASLDACKEEVVLQLNDRG